MHARTLGAVLLSVGLLAQAQEFALDNLPTLHNFQSHRITSAEPTGGNHDFRELQPGQTLVLADIKGPGRIAHFRDNITRNEPHHLQLHMLRMYWDGETEPSVEAPVGDFFGVGFGFTEKMSSALMCIDQRPGKLTDSAAFGAARNCYFPMPFKRAARITITNEGRQPSQHWYEVNYRTYTGSAQDQGTSTRNTAKARRPEGPYTILEARGAGPLVGCVLSVKNNDGGWWGEGDEIVYIDGRHAIQGTGWRIISANPTACARAASPISE